MVPIMSLWIPILVAAVFVFIASSIIHMALGYHRHDFKKLPAEGEVLETLRRLEIPRGDYMAPWACSMKEVKSPEFIEKRTKGPILIMTLWPGGPVTMGGQLLLWFLYTVLVGIFAAYITGRALGPGAEYLSVFRFAGASAFSSYSLALLQQSIWYKRSWATTLRQLFDGLIYALLTAGTFGWLWPGRSV